MPMPDEWGDQPIPDPFETEKMKEERIKRKAKLKEMVAELSGIPLPRFLEGTQQDK